MGAGIGGVGQKHEVRPDVGAIFGDRGGEGGGHMAGAHEIGTPAQKPRQDVTDEPVAGSGAGVENAAGLTQGPDVVTVEGGQPAGPDVLDDRCGKKRSFYREEVQPLGGGRGGGSTSGGCHRRAVPGTRWTTAAGNHST